MLGSLLALASAFTFGLNAAIIRRGVLTGTALQGMAINVPLGVPIFIVAAAAAGSIGLLFEFSLQAYLFLAISGVIHFAFGRYCNARALKAMGGNLVRPIHQLNVLLALVLALWLLDEVLTPLRIFGIVLVMLGPLFVLQERKAFSAKMEALNATQEDKDLHFTPNYTEGMFFAIISILGYGFSPVLVRAAVGDMGISGGLAGGIVSYSAATAVILIALLWPKNLTEVRAMSGRTAELFTLSAFCIGSSQLLRFMALGIAPVVVVSTIQQTTSIFQVLFAWIMNRNHEPFGIWVMLGIASSLIGAVALTLTTEFVLEMIDLPVDVQNFIRWTWP